MKCLYVVEWAGYFQQLKDNPDQKLVTLILGFKSTLRTTGC